VLKAGHSHINHAAVLAREEALRYQNSIHALIESRHLCGSLSNDGKLKGHRWRMWSGRWLLVVAAAAVSGAGNDGAPNTALP